MPTYTPTTNRALRWLTGSNLVRDIDAGFQALAEDVDAQFGPKGYAEVLTSQVYAGGATVGDLATVGPTVTLTVPTNGLVTVFAVADLVTNAAEGFVHLTEDGVDLGVIIDLSIAGATGTVYTTPGNLATAANPDPVRGTISRARSGWITFPATAASHVYKLRYHGNATYSNRKLWVRAAA